MLVEELPEKTALRKHFYDSSKYHVCYESIKDRVLLTKAQEMSEEFLNKNLLNSNYSKLSFMDFNTFDELLKERRSEELKFWTREEYVKYKRTILQGVTKGTLPPPIILQDLSGKYILFSGEARMLAHKVMGISPVVKIVNVDYVLTNQ